jgi:hypothetical protein
VTPLIWKVSVPSDQAIVQKSPPAPKRAWQRARTGLIQTFYIIHLVCSGILGSSHSFSSFSSGCPTRETEMLARMARLAPFAVDKFRRSERCFGAISGLSETPRGFPILTLAELHWVGVSPGRVRAF